MNTRAPRRAWALALAALAIGAAAPDAHKRQEIVFEEIAARMVDDAPFDVAARATSGLPVSLVVVSGPAVLDGRRLRLTGVPGLVIIRASQAGDAVYLPARDAERAFTVRPRPVAPAILSGPTDRSAAIGDTVLLAVRASGEPPPDIQWRKDGAPIAGATGATLTITSAEQTDAGVYDAVASNPLGSAPSAPARVTVSKRPQAITFQSSTSAVAAGQQVVLSARATSGLPVRFEILSGAATLNGAMLTSPGGLVTVQATQAGDSTYEPALPVSQTFVFGTGVGARSP